jgi:uncharacterized repeat protein (TIGR02059 family)
MLHINKTALSLTYRGLSARFIVIQDIVVDGSTVTLTFSEPLDEDSVPSPDDFELFIDGSPGPNVTAVDVVGNTVVLTTASPPSAGDPTVTYTVGDTPLLTEGGVQVSGFPAAAPGTPVPPVTPVLGNVYKYGTGSVLVVITLDGITLDSVASTPAPADFVVTIGGTPVTVSTVTVNGNSITVVITGGDVTSGEVIITYSPSAGQILTSQGVVVSGWAPATADDGTFTQNVGQVLSRFQAPITAGLITDVQAVFTTLSTTADKLDVLVLPKFAKAKNQQDGCMNWIRDYNHASPQGSCTWIKGTGFQRPNTGSTVGYIDTNWRNSIPLDTIRYGTEDGGMKQGSFGGWFSATVAGETSLQNLFNSLTGAGQYLTWVPASTQYAYAIDTANRNTGSGQTGSMGFHMVNAIRSASNLVMTVFRTTTAAAPSQVGSAVNSAGGDVATNNPANTILGPAGSPSGGNGFRNKGYFIGSGMDATDRGRLGTLLFGQ